MELKIVSMIPFEKRKECRCHFCGETRSVKYLVETFDPVVHTQLAQVYCCNTCALSKVMEADKRNVCSL